MSEADLSEPFDNPASEPPLEATWSLIVRARDGDRTAREHLFSRYLPRLKRWAHGRLPATVRAPDDTDDFVQNTLIRALNHLDDFEPRHEGAFLAYLRTILLNQIRDAIRRANGRPARIELDDSIADPDRSPLERAIASDELDRYERALTLLSPDHRAAVILRLELDFSYREIAEALARPNENASRQLVLRALGRLAQVMHEQR